MIYLFDPITKLDMKIYDNLHEINPRKYTMAKRAITENYIQLKYLIYATLIDIHSLDLVFSYGVVK